MRQNQDGNEKEGREQRHVSFKAADVKMLCMAPLSSAAVVSSLDQHCPSVVALSLPLDKTQCKVRSRPGGHNSQGQVKLLSAVIWERSLWVVNATVSWRSTSLIRSTKWSSSAVMPALIMGSMFGWEPGIALPSTSSPVAT
ncbi:unnamed protein product [Pleuronectes platessa]|uniref:Uncharacterized protein n=1 Tax=Pleuronectes platessa TaxID=8262 RepID=A0A9N7TIE8_PLEPL|nr:unnamed protein product [Pleuronectes platessa]